MASENTFLLAYRCLRIKPLFNLLEIMLNEQKLTKLSSRGNICYYTSGINCAAYEVIRVVFQFFLW
jgi:hypothetical protein